MILACQQCQTRFRLDEARIPSEGARVRCSKCNHAFTVRPPEVDPEVTFDGVVAEAVEEAIPAPEPGAGAAGPEHTDPGLSEALEPVGEVPPDQWTFSDEAPVDAADTSPASGLFGTSDDLVGDSAGARAAEPLPGTNPDDPLEALAREVAAEKGAAPPQAEPKPAPAPPQAKPKPTPAPPQAKPAAAPSPAPAEASTAGANTLDGLGDPAEWDFLADSVPETPVEARVEPPPVAAGAVEAAPARPGWVLPPALASLLSRLGGAAGWAGAVGLILVGLAQVLWPAPVATTSPAPLQLVRGDPEVRGLSSRHLENLHGGAMLVVGGEVAARSAGPDGLRVQLLDAAGRPLEGGRAWAGPPLGERVLRELDPDRIRARLQDESPALRPGGLFHAVFPSPPVGARGVAVMAAALPREPRLPPSPSPAPE